MNRFAILAFTLLSGGSAFAVTDVGVSIGIAQPGVYGRIDIGNLPPPALVYAQPVVIAPAPYAVHRRPIYLYVPTWQQQHWVRYCGRYGACGQPVYFVREQWVRERYQHDHPGWARGHGRGHGHGHGHGHGKHRD